MLPDSFIYTFSVRIRRNNGPGNVFVSNTISVIGDTLIHRISCQRHGLFRADFLAAVAGDAERHIDDRHAGVAEGQGLLRALLDADTAL